MMMLFILLGGAKWNVLNAQETITIGEGATVEAFVPSNINYDNTISQQIFLEADFQGKTGDITHYAFKCAKNLSNITRYFKIYMYNTDKTSLSGNTDWVNAENNKLVFEGDVLYGPIDTWTVIEFDTPFTYNGGNVIVCIN